jgi:hypothetical protein
MPVAQVYLRNLFSWMRERQRRSAAQKTRKLKEAELLRARPAKLAAVQEIRLRLQKLPLGQRDPNCELHEYMEDDDPEIRIAAVRALIPIQGPPVTLSVSLILLNLIDVYAGATDQLRNKINRACHMLDPTWR